MKTLEIEDNTYFNLELARALLGKKTKQEALDQLLDLYADWVEAFGK